MEESDNKDVAPYRFNAKELDEETGLYYYGARYLDPTSVGWLSVDPLFEKYVGMSPYNYCAGNPVKLVDPDGRDIYGLDVNSGRLSFVKESADENDIVTTGEFKEDGSFLEEKLHQSLIITKGILKSRNSKEDLSREGISIERGSLDDGLKLTEFLSYNSNKEVMAWGYINNGDKYTSENVGLEIEPWYKNDVTNSYSLKFSNPQSFSNRKQRRVFHLHTHPGSKDGTKYGGGKPSKADFNFAKKHAYTNQIYFYILSRRLGLIVYNEEGSYYRANPKFLVGPLKKYVKK